MGYPDEITEPLLSTDGFDDMIAGLPLGMARQFHACTHTTFAPTVIDGGSKINTIPDLVELEVDIRTLPGDGEEAVMAELRAGPRRPRRRGRVRARTATTAPARHRSTRRCGTPSRR